MITKEELDSYLILAYRLKDEREAIQKELLRRESEARARLAEIEIEIRRSEGIVLYLRQRISEQQAPAAMPDVSEQEFQHES